MAFSQYYVTEAEMGALFRMSGLPEDFQRLFARDYVAFKSDAGSSNDLLAALTSRVDDNDDDIADIYVQIGILDSRIDTNDGLIAAINVNLSALSASFSAHAAATSAHGSNGAIVGVNNFATLATGGTVKLAAAVADQADSTVVVANSPNAAPVAYAQADAATWVTLLNELKTDVNQLVTDLNALTAKVNTMLASERTALQRAP